MDVKNQSGTRKLFVSWYLLAVSVCGVAASSAVVGYTALITYTDLPGLFTPGMNLFVAIRTLLRLYDKHA